MRPTVSQRHDWRFPTPAISQLPQGMTVWAFDLPHQPLVTAAMVVPVRLTAEPRAVEGISATVFSLALEASVTHPDGALNDAVESLGALAGGACLPSHTRVVMDMPARYLPQAMPLFAEILQEPSFTDAELARHVEWRIASHRTGLANAPTQARKAFKRLAFGPQARESRPSSGLPDSLSDLTTTEVASWHAATYTPRGSTLILAGDLSAAPLSELVSPLASWEGQDPNAYEAPSPQTAGTCVVVDIPNAVQAHVVAGGLAPGRQHPDWAALRCAGHALAGGFSSRLNLILREAQGLTYGVSGGFAPRPTDSLFSVSTSVAVAAVGQAVREILTSLEVAESFADAEINAAARYLRGVAPLANETSGDIAAQAAALAVAGMPTSYVNDHMTTLAAVSGKDATAAFREHVPAVHLAIAGPSATVVPQLEALGLEPQVVEPT